MRSYTVASTAKILCLPYTSQDKQLKDLSFGSLELCVCVDPNSGFIVGKFCSL